MSLDIEAIRRRYGRVEAIRDENDAASNAGRSVSYSRIVAALGRSADDVPDLLAEIERLRAAIGGEA